MKWLFFFLQGWSYIRPICTAPSLKCYNIVAQRWQSLRNTVFTSGGFFTLALLVGWTLSSLSRDSDRDAGGATCLIMTDRITRTSPRLLAVQSHATLVRAGREAMFVVPSPWGPLGVRPSTFQAPYCEQQQGIPARLVPPQCPREEFTTPSVST